ncbi:MAG: RiPP maturation radical SAM C-methyltransferase [Planctomycetota bacterium]
MDPAPAIALVSMPWMLVDTPSIQLGMLQAALRPRGMQATVHSLHLGFVDWAVRHAAPGRPALSPQQYEDVSTRWSNLGVPEWLFAVPPWGPAPRGSDREFERALRRAGMGRDLLATLRGLRERIGEFLAECADEVLAAAPPVVGFTLTYSQTLPSLALARALRRRAPDLRVVFGGASCDGPMGPAMLRAWPEVDLVVRGEGERVLPDLLTALAADDRAAVCALPGLCWRDGDRVVANDTMPGQRADLATLEVPDYDEYFARLAHSRAAGAIAPRIPYQSARGCWWGMKSHCAFCGLNGTDMEFRSKPAARVLTELRALAAAHGVVEFSVVDNIMDMGYLRTVVPALAAGPDDFGLFCETKANLTRDQVTLLGRAGVRTIQPGIESLSTGVLRRMGKGTSALQNLRLMKWCAEQGMHVLWNLLYGFPGEDEDEYRRMAELVPSLLHLTPPSMTPLMLARFSPYHAAPARYGLERGAPLPLYEQFYGVDRALAEDLAAVFEHRHLDGRDPERYAAPLREQVARWRREFERNRGALTYRRGPGFLVVTDTRTGRAPARYQLDAVEAAVYLACDAGATAATARERAAAATGDEVSAATVDALMQGFVDARIACRDGDRVLGLALRASAAWGREPAAVAVDAAIATVAAR